MVRRPALLPLLVVAATALAPAQTIEPSAISDALRPALAPALPFPETQPDGTAPGGDTDPVWTVTWPGAAGLLVNVVANPENPGNRQRALKAEEEIQKAAMASQRRSQADYEQALSDFQRTGRVGSIREISLSDDGLAGERFDAESQLTIRAELFEGTHAFTVATSRMPQALPASGGPAFIVRVAANTYRDAGAPDAPGQTRFCPEQAWVFFGALRPADLTRAGETVVGISVGTAAEASRGLVVAISGNVELVDRVLRQADWALLRARLGG
jgi:hypothetical protein